MKNMFQIFEIRGKRFEYLNIIRSPKFSNPNIRYSRKKIRIRIESEYIRSSLFCAPETVRLPLGPACVLPWAATAPLRPLAPASTHALVPPGCILSRPCQGRGSIQTHWSSNRNPVVRRVLLWNLKLRICIGTCKTQYF